VFAISPRKNYVAAGTINGWLYLSMFPAAANHTYDEVLFQKQNTRINDIAFDQQGLFVATAGADSKVRLTTINLVKEAPLEYPFASWVNAVLFIEPMKLMVGTEDGEVYLLNFDQQQLAERCRMRLNAAQLKSYRKD